MKPISGIKYLFLLGIIFVSACNHKQAEEKTYIAPLPKEAVTIESVDDSSSNESTGIMPYFSLDDSELSGIDENDSLYWSVEICAKDDKNIYLLKEYYKLGDQYAEKYDLMSRNCETGEQRTILKSDDGVYWMNEFQCAGDFLYFVEYYNVLADNGEYSPVYKIVQYNLLTNEKTVMAERDGSRYDEICLEANKGYVTWYDSVYESETDSMSHHITVYNVSEKKYLDLPIDMLPEKYAPYERLNLYDNGITYFSTDSEGFIWVNRIQLNTEKKSKVRIGTQKDYKKLVGCYSTNSYIGWRTDYSSGEYYFYDFESEKLYVVKGDEFFSFYCRGNDFYVNCRDKIYIYNVSDLTVRVRNFENCEGYFFKACDNGELDIILKQGLAVID